MRDYEVQPQHVTPEVQAWVRAQAALGHTAPTILKALRKSGWAGGRGTRSSCRDAADAVRRAGAAACHWGGTAARMLATGRSMC